MQETPQQNDVALTWLKWLVIGLTATMMVGLIILIWLFVTRFPTGPVALPDELRLPDGTQAMAFTRGPDWVAIVTTTDEILIYSDDMQTIVQRIKIAP